MIEYDSFSYLIPKAVCNYCLNILENALATLKLNYIQALSSGIHQGTH